ncbi:MAG: dTDP-4-dehydrorhamnose 3,5-epimerase [Phycisphaerales bacterium]|nr:MAG: dTDP-4-dehydrorhamnose 3,5-epimerase [Phycisphaerales bacterium]
MKVYPTDIPDVLVVEPTRHADDRGVFCETYNRQRLRGAGIDAEFVQDNHSISSRAGTVRGLHYQSPPHAQAKLIRVVAGAIFDVAVDLRVNSPTFSRHVAVTISALDWKQIYIPAGFAHGFCTLEPSTHVLYKVDHHFVPECDHGVRWNDADLAIPWPVDASKAILSERDRIHPTFSELQDTF